MNNRFCLNFVAVALVFALVLASAGCRSTSPLEAVRLNQEAQILLDHGQIYAAHHRLDASLDADYENPASHYWLARVYEMENNPEKAEYHYRLAIRFAPAMDAAHLALIRLLHNEGKLDPSVQAARFFLENKTVRAADIIQLGKNFADEGMNHQAVLAFERAAELEPDNPQPYLALADYYLRHDDKQKAVSALTSAFILDPYYPGLARQLGDLGQRVDIPEPELFKPTPEIQREMYGLD